MTRSEGKEALALAKKLMRKRKVQQGFMAAGIGFLTVMMSSVAAGYGRAEALGWLMEDGLKNPDTIWEDEKDKQ